MRRAAGPRSVPVFSRLSNVSSADVREALSVPFLRARWPKNLREAYCVVVDPDFR